MARKPTPATPRAADTTDAAAAKKASAALTEMSKRSAEVAERFADGLAYDRERVVAEAKFLMSQSAEAMLEAGKRLVQIKENEPFGEFMSIVQDRLGLGERSARAMMQAAVKYLSPALESKRQSIAVLGKSKMFDLMVEADEALADLAEGGTIAGKTLDDMQAMSRRELQAALTDARQTIDAKEKVIAKRDAKLAKLEEKAELPQEAAMLADIQERIRALVAAALQLGNLVVELDGREISEELRTMVNADCEYAAQTFADILMRAGIPVQFQEMVDPSWMKKAGKTGRKG